MTIYLLVMIGLVVFVAAAYFLRRADKYTSNGTWSTAVQALASVAFGAGSLLVALSVYELQVTQREDAELERAATLIHQVHDESGKERRMLEDDKATAGFRSYECITYLKDRVIYMPRWTAETLTKAPYLIDPLEFGKPPERSDLPEDKETHWDQLYDELYEQFKMCIGTDDLDDNDNRPTPKWKIRERGIKIKRMIDHPLIFAEMDLFEWPTLTNDSKAKKLIEDEVKGELCASEVYKADIFDLFDNLRQLAKDPNSGAERFASAFLAEYPYVDKFLKKVCKPFFESLNH